MSNQKHEQPKQETQTEPVNDAGTVTVTNAPTSTTTPLVIAVKLCLELLLRQIVYGQVGRQFEVTVKEAIASLE